jgi:SAM-dependent methyltransferase
MNKLIKKLIPANVKKVIGRSYLFWGYRSFFVGKGVWSAYKDSYKDDRRSFYSDFVIKNACITILDFGCASGPNLIRIEKDSPNTKYKFLGIDVSNDALKIAREEIKSEAVFEKTLTSKNVSQLANLGCSGFVDLAIFDRVLTLLTERDLVQTFSLLSSKTTHIIIDDFFSKNKHQGPVWLARDYEGILRHYGYDLISKQKSRHQATSDFHNEYAFLAVFSKKLL